MIPELPLTLVTRLERRLITATAVATSPFTGTEQVQDWGGEWWDYTIELAQRPGRDGRRLSAFFASLGGIRGRFLFRDPSVLQAGSFGAPVVAGGFQSGTTLMTAGWAPSLPTLRTGDLISLGTDGETRLHQLTADVLPDYAGRATLQLVPRLRAAPGDGDPIEIAVPAVLLRLTAPVPSLITRADMFRFSLTAREAL